jgi:hypothetical protein
MQRLAILGTTAAVATVIAAVSTTSGGAQAPGERTFKVIEGAGGTFGFVDNPPKAGNRRNPRTSPGDAFAFTTPLFNEDNRRIGAVHAQCVVTRGGTQRRTVSHCTGTFLLPDGTLAASAVAKGDSPPIAIVGGTGAYEGARGSITERDLPRGRTEDTIHLLP